MRGGLQALQLLRRPRRVVRRREVERRRRPVVHQRQRVVRACCLLWCLVLPSGDDGVVHLHHRLVHDGPRRLLGEHAPKLLHFPPRRRLERLHDAALYGVNVVVVHLVVAGGSCGGSSTGRPHASPTVTRRRCRPAPLRRRLQGTHRRPTHMVQRRSHSESRMPEASDRTAHGSAQQPSHPRTLRPYPRWWGMVPLTPQGCVLLPRAV